MTNFINNNPIVAIGLIAILALTAVVIAPVVPATVAALMGNNFEGGGGKVTLTLGDEQPTND